MGWKSELTADLAGTAYMIQPVCFTWANKILLRTGDEVARAVTLYAMNGASSVLYVPSSLLKC